MTKYTFEITWRYTWKDDDETIVLIKIEETDFMRAWEKAFFKAKMLTHDYEELESIECISMTNERI